MKTKLFFVVISFVAFIAFAGCGNSRQVAKSQQELGNREIQMPCTEAGFDTKDYYAGMGIGENVNMQNARTAAIDAAKQMLLKKVGGMVKGLATSYSKSTSGNAPQDAVERIIEGEFATVVEKMLNDADQTCEKMYQTATGTYQSHIALRISKAEIAKEVSTALSENDQLKAQFDREQFRKFAEEYMQKMSEQ